MSSSSQLRPATGAISDYASWPNPILRASMTAHASEFGRVQLNMPTWCDLNKQGRIVSLAQPRLLIAGRISPVEIGIMRSFVKWQRQSTTIPEHEQASRINRK